MRAGPKWAKTLHDCLRIHILVSFPQLVKRASLGKPATAAEGIAYRAFGR